MKATPSGTLTAGPAPRAGGNEAALRAPEVMRNTHSSQQPCAHKRHSKELPLTDSRAPLSPWRALVPAQAGAPAAVEGAQRW